MGRDDIDNRIDLELARARRPVLPPPPPKIELARIGVHWEASFPDALHFRLDHIVESRDEFSGELTITLGGDVLSWGRMNLTSMPTRSTLAKQLSNKAEADWTKYLDLFCRSVVERERTPITPATFRGHRPREGAEYILEPIVPVGLPTVFYGSGGVGKSTLAAGIVVSVASGCEVFAGWKPLSCPVLVLDWEGRPEDWTERVQEIATGCGIEFPEFHYMACRRRLKDDIEVVADEIAKHSIGLVVVDSCSLAFGLSSYSEADPAETAIKAFTAIRDLGIVSWVLIDHVSGAVLENDAVASKAYGSVKKRDLARQMFHVAGSRGSSDSQELVITHTKANYSGYLKPQGIRVDRREGSLAFTMTSELQAPELADKMPMSDRILELLKPGKQRAERLKEMLGIDPKDKRAQTLFRVSLHRLVTTYHRVAKLSGEEYGLATPSEQLEEVL
jgi:hypothetical protein